MDPFNHLKPDEGGKACFPCSKTLIIISAQRRNSAFPVRGKVNHRPMKNRG